MTDEEAAAKVSPEELAAYRHVADLEIGHIGPYGSSMYYGHQVREAFLAGAAYARIHLLPYDPTYETKAGWEGW